MTGYHADILFTDKDGKGYSQDDLYRTLLAVGADECETVFIHSDVAFGSVRAGFQKKDYIQALGGGIERIGVKNIIVPTFTFSFCNHEDYDVINSRSLMGALSEYYRRMDGRFRTKDPLLSLSVPVSLRKIFDEDADHSLGAGSGLDILHGMDDVKFLFFGAPMREYFTYLHYIEKMLDVPYRFDMPFSGRIIDETGNSYEKTQFIHTVCDGVVLRTDHFENEMRERGFLKERKLGDKTVSCIAEKDVYREIRNRIEKDVNYFLEKPFAFNKAKRRYTMGRDGGKITHC